MEKLELVSFLRKHRIGVLSTIHENGTPESAVVEFGETDELELIFNTSKSSRKYANLMRNPRVAFVIGWDEKITVQYEGVARELNNEEHDRYEALYISKNPDVAKWHDRPGFQLFAVTPTWIRYSDLGKDPWEIQGWVF